MDPRITGIQRESSRRGFAISHQKVVLEIDFSGVLWGYTELTIVPTSNELRTLHLHCRQSNIHSVTVANIDAEFAYHDPVSNLTVGASDPKDCHNHPEIKRKLYSALQESDEGELSIAIPPGVSLKQSSSDSTLMGMYSDAATPEPQTPGASSSQLPGGVEFAPIVVHIEYTLTHPVDGLQFVLPTESYPYRVPHALPRLHLRTQPAAGFHASITFGRKAHGNCNSSSRDTWKKDRLLTRRKKEMRIMGLYQPWWCAVESWWNRLHIRTAPTKPSSSFRKRRRLPCSK